MKSNKNNVRQLHYLVDEDCLDPYEPVYISKSNGLIFTLFDQRANHLKNIFEITKASFNSYILYESKKLEHLIKYGFQDEECNMYIDESIVGIEEELSFDKNSIEHLYASFIAMLLSVVEALLKDLSVELAAEKGIDVELAKGNMPYINKYLDFLKSKCGLHISIHKQTYRKINDLRKIRNHMVHSLGADFPDQLRVKMEQTLGAGIINELVSENTVDLAFNAIVEFVYQIEDAYVNNQR